MDRRVQLGDLARSKRLANRQSLVNLAYESGVSMATITKIEKGLPVKDETLGKVLLRLGMMDALKLFREAYVLKEYRKGESKYTDFFFISGFQRSSGHEAIYLIDLSKYPDIKIIDQKVTKVPYLPLDKSIILVYNGNSIDYSIVCLKNNNIMDLHDEGFIRVYDKAKKIENKECKFLILDVITNIDECLFNNSKKCYSLNYTKTVTEESGINIEFHVLTYQVGDKKFYVQISNNKNFSLWMITNKTTIKSGKINELDYEFVMNYLYK
jgi:transcriptional regulator with XRE-family HTH domain